MTITFRERCLGLAKYLHLDEVRVWCDDRWGGGSSTQRILTPWAANSSRPVFLVWKVSTPDQITYTQPVAEQHRWADVSRLDPKDQEQTLTLPTKDSGLAVVLSELISRATQAFHKEWEATRISREKGYVDARLREVMGDNFTYVNPNNRYGMYEESFIGVPPRMGNAQP